LVVLGATGPFLGGPFVKYVIIRLVGAHMARQGTVRPGLVVFMSVPIDTTTFTEPVTASELMPPTRVKGTGKVAADIHVGI
jgi:hypothetical protein